MSGELIESSRLSEISLALRLMGSLGHGIEMRSPVDVVDAQRLTEGVAVASMVERLSPHEFICVLSARDAKKCGVVKIFVRAVASMIALSPLWLSMIALSPL